MEQTIGVLLRGGVILAAAIVAAGGLLYVVRHGSEPPGHHVFEGEPASLRSVGGIVSEALNGSARSTIQLGLLALIATPVARVVFTVFAFARQRDYVYVFLTLVVAGVLTYSLFWGGAQ
jgi:uncharacterized membrane protein